MLLLIYYIEIEIVFPFLKLNFTASIKASVCKLESTTGIWKEFRYSKRNR